MNWAMLWLYQNLTGRRALRANGDRCAICGLPLAGDTPLGKVLRPTFTDHDLLANRDGYACTACTWYMDHQELRRQSWYLTENEARPLAKADLLPLLRSHYQDPPAEDRYYLIARSKKKHVALHGRLNAAGCRAMRVNLETSLVDVDGEWFKLLDGVVALRRYHAWDEIEADRYLPFAILKWPSLADFERAREAVRPWLRSPAWELARYLYHPDLAKEMRDGDN